MKDELKTWYQQINEEDILPNGLIKARVPVIDAETSEPIKIGCPEIKAEQPIEVPETKPEDPVGIKDKSISLRAFVLSRRIQDLLLRISGLDNPYENQSEERYDLATQLREIHKELGEELGKL